MSLTPQAPELFVTLSQRFGLLLAGGFAIMTLAPLNKVAPGRKRPLWATLAMILMFSLFGILGTYTGNYVFKSVANMRAIAAITAGLFGGPVVGTSVGMIAGGHRYLIDIGGFSAFPCALATILEGLAAGLLAWRMPSRALDWSYALVLCFVGEIVHMLLVLGLSRPYEEALALVQVIGAPMVVINTCGTALLVQALRLQIRFRDLQDSSQTRQILSIANQTLSHLRGGLKQESARATAEIILEETRAAAVAVTTRETILAHVGLGGEHHVAGGEVLTRATLRAVQNGEAVFISEKEDVGCSYPGCPLQSSIIVPLRKAGIIIGCLKLYGSRDKPLDQTMFELARGLADLFSTQLELEDVSIQRQLTAHAEIRRLQAQINPHFLFNSLNTIASFCRSAPAQARELILELSKYMRVNLDSSRGLIRLSEEIEQIRSYLSIEQARFGERIRAEIHILEGTEDWLIPPLIIQPIVENGVRHGVLGREEGGLIRLTAGLADNHLHVVVEDEGVGMTDEDIKNLLTPSSLESMSEGIGARNSNRRLIQLFGQDYAMRIESEPGTGTRVSFRIPASGSA